MAGKKPDPDKLKKTVQGMQARAEELGWSAKMKAEEARKAMADPNFVSIDLDNTWKPWKDKEGGGNQGGFTVVWGAEKVGFGEIAFYKDLDGRLCMRTEYMGKEFAKKALMALVDKAVNKE